MASHRLPQPHDVAIEYRADPQELPTASIIAELFAFIGDAERWRNDAGQHARERAAALRAELRWRERGAA